MKQIVVGIMVRQVKDGAGGWSGMTVVTYCVRVFNLPRSRIEQINDISTTPLGGNGTDAQNSSTSNPYPNMTNIPNMQIDQNTGKWRQVIESEHISVIEKYVEGKNYGQIARWSIV